MLVFPLEGGPNDADGYTGASLPPASVPADVSEGECEHVAESEQFVWCEDEESEMCVFVLGDFGCVERTVAVSALTPFSATGYAGGGGGGGGCGYAICCGGYPPGG